MTGEETHQMNTLSSRYMRGTVSYRYISSTHKLPSGKGFMWGMALVHIGTGNSGRDVILFTELQDNLLWATAGPTLVTLDLLVLL